MLNPIALISIKMKPKFATFYFIFLLLSCNTSNKKISQVEIKETTKDTVLSTKTTHFNITKVDVLGQFNYKNDTTFVKASSDHSAKALYLKNETYDAFVRMYNAAKKDSIELKILSATRNFEEQKAIWDRKWLKYKSLKPTERINKIMEYSAMPSTSRHHWGTDIDLNSLNNSYFNSGKGKQEYEWLVNNANAYGFYQVYTTKENGRTGYNLEKWHWSYLPLASKYLEFYNANITYQDISGFKGSELAKELNIIDNYVNGIAKNAKTYINN